MVDHHAEEDVAGDVTRIVRAASSMSMRMIDMMARRREEQRRRQADGQREAAAALAERQRAQRDAMHALVTPALDPRWRSEASDREVATAYVYAEAYADHSDLARLVRDRLGDDIERRHGDVAGYVDEHVQPEDLERVPAPSGHLSTSQERLVQARQDATAEETRRREEAALEEAREAARRHRDAALEAHDSHDRGILLASLVNDDLAGEWARISEVVSPKRADRWLEQEVGPDVMRTMRAHELWAQEEREMDQADTDREQASQTRDGAEREHLEDRAAQREDHAEDQGEQADMERAGLGQFTHTERDLEKVEQADPEAAAALRASRAGRSESAARQVRQGRARGSQRARVRATGQKRGRENDRSR